MKWRCIEPGHWMAEVDGWEWHAWALRHGWQVDGWINPGGMWSFEVQSLAEARTLAATIVAQLTEAKVTS